MFRVINKETGETVAEGATKEQFIDAMKATSVDPQVIRELLLGVTKDEEE